MAKVIAKPAVDYGPLAALIGVWEGDKGIDVAPEPDGSEEHPYYETMTFEAGGDLKNAKKQVLAIVRYLQIVRRKSNHEVFHDQTGYWMWDASAGVVIQSLAIPRALCLVAAGRYRGAAKPKGKIELKVSAKLSDPAGALSSRPSCVTTPGPRSSATP